MGEALENFSYNSKIVAGTYLKDRKTLYFAGTLHNRNNAVIPAKRFNFCKIASF